MDDRTLLRLAFLALTALPACTPGETAMPTVAAPDMTGWRLVSGKAPTKAEFAALTATCQERSKGDPLDACLANLGLKRGQ